MTQSFWSLRSVAVVALVTALTGCNIPVEQLGNLPKPDDLAKVKPGETDKATVTTLLGSPSSVAAFDGDTWYYISQQTKQVAFFSPELLDQEVVVLHFNKDGIVTAIDRKNLDDREVVTPNPNATPAPGREFTFLEQLIGNFGKYAGKDDKAAGGAGGGGSGGGH
jgi:outer membrane protein assembly factor BamE (lipoprotein component of BamABCDE complex)